MELLHAGVSHPVPPGGGRLGSGDGVWLRLQGTGVLPQHAQLRVESAGVLIVAATPEAAILVNGTAVGPAAHLLADGDRIGIGGELLLVKAPAGGGGGHGRSRPTPPPGAAQQLADTLAGVPSFSPKTPIQGSIRQPGGPAAPQPAEGAPSGGRWKVGLVVVAVVLLGGVLFLLMGR